MAKKADVTLVFSLDSKGAVTGVKKFVGQASKDLEKLAGITRKTTDAQKGLGKQIDEGTVTYEKARSGLSKFRNMLKGNFAAIAAGMGTAMLFSSVISGIKNAISNLINTGREFEREWANVTTMMTVSQQESDKLRQGLLNLPPILGKATDLAKGMYQVLSASIEPAKALDFLAVSAKAAKAGVTDTRTAVDALTTVINAYGLQAKDATKISDIMFQTVKRGKLTYEGMAGAIGTVVPIASQVGVGFEEIAAAMATLTRQGINVNTTTVSLRQILVSILKPTKQASEEAKRLGLEFTASSLRAKGLVKFLQDVIEKTGGNVESMTTLFGNVRALTGIMGLAGNSAVEFAHDLELMRNASGSTEDAFRKQIETSDAQIKMFNNTIERFAINFYAGFVEGFIKSSSEIDKWNEKVAIANKRAEITGSWLSKIITGFKDYHPLAVAIKAITQKQAEAEVALETAMRKRTEQQNLFVSGLGPLGSAFGTTLNVYNKLVSMIVSGNKPIEEQLDLLKKVRTEYFMFTKSIKVLTDEEIKFIEKVKKATEQLRDHLASSEKFKVDMQAMAKVLSEVSSKGGNLRSTYAALENEIKTLYTRAKVMKEIFGKEIPKALQNWYDRMREATSVFKLYRNGVKTTLLQEKAWSQFRIEQGGRITQFNKTILNQIKYLSELGRVSDELGAKSFLQLNSELQKLEQNFKKWKDSFPAKQQITIIEGILRLYKELGFVAPDAYDKLLKKLREIVKEQDKAAQASNRTWVKSFTSLAVAFSVYADTLSGKWTRLMRDLATAFEKMAETLKDKSKNLGDALVEIGSVLAGQIGGVFGELISGTESAIAGFTSAIGSAIGGMVGGKVGEVVGGFLGGLIGGLFGKKKEETAEEKRARIMGYWVDALIKKFEKWGEVSESTAKIIAEEVVDKGMKGYIAVSKHFARIISDVGVSLYNMSELWTRAGHIVDHFTTGELSAKDATESLNDSFKLLLDGTQKLNREGSREMIEFIRKVRASGLEVASVTDYVLGQLDRIPKSLTTLIGNVGVAFEKIGDVTGINVDYVTKRLKNLGRVSFDVFNAMIS